MDPAKFKLGMRRLVSGVTIVTTLYEGQRHGLVVSAVSSLSATPPSLLVCVGQSASAHAHIAASGILCVNVLSDTQREHASRFSNSAYRDHRFDAGDWRALTTGAPALAGSLVSFDCRIRKAVQYQTHSIFIGEIVEIELWAPAIHPLLYMDGSYRHLESGPPAPTTVEAIAREA